MTELTWSDELAVHHPDMDTTHAEFVAYIAALQALRRSPADAPLAQVLGTYDEMLAHTQSHFDQEDRWMDQLGFAPGNCHASQHTQVLAALREVRRLIEVDHKPQVLDELLPELIHWFRMHAQAADAALASHLREAERAAAQGAAASPVADGLRESCGSAQCAH